MAHFIKDNTSLGDAKSNYRVSNVPASKKVAATDWNTLRQALLDTRESVQELALAALTAARSDAADMPDGPPAAMTETGQAMTAFGNSPLVVSGGEISHTWNGSTSSSAGYMQTRPRPGSTCVRVGAIVRAAPGSVSSFDLVLPSTAWADGNLTAAGVHYVVETNGAWQMAFWDGAAVHLYGSGTIDPWDDDTERRVEVYADVATSTVSVQHPDGSVSSFTDSRIAANLSEYCVWELFALSGAAEVSPPKILRFWADTAEGDSRGLVGQLDMARAIAPVLDAATGIAADTFILHAPTTQLTSTTTTAAAGVGTGTLFAVITPGNSGKVLVEVSAYYEFAAADTLFWRATVGGTNSPVIAAHIGDVGEKKLVRQVMLVSGLTPGSPLTVAFSHWTISNGSATLKAGGSGGSMTPPVFLRAVKVG